MAVKAMFDSGKERFIEGIGKCLLGRINSKEVGAHNMILAEAGMGNNMAALCAEKLRQKFPTVDTFVMVGIAGAVPYPEKPEHHVRLGDIVVCDEKGVIQYDFISKAKEIQYRNPPRAPKAGFLKAAKVLCREEKENKFPWNDYIDEGIRIRGEEWKRPASKYDKLFDHRSGGVIRHPVDINRRNNEPRIFLGAIASGNTLL
ncbi:MAG: 5'-methylthioadenosine/S-adenosylhomocysteine nucleosidase, partial [bacterium]|nr:5'-methylthioadenosine/S-adenosylhomocysteine nucleosidase [bacterium]